MVTFLRRKDGLFPIKYWAVGDGRYLCILNDDSIDLFISSTWSERQAATWFREFYPPGNLDTNINHWKIYRDTKTFIEVDKESIKNRKTISRWKGFLKA